MRAIRRWCVLSSIAIVACGGRVALSNDAPLGAAGLSGSGMQSAGGVVVGPPAPEAGRSAVGGSQGAISTGGTASAHTGWGGVAGTSAGGLGTAGMAANNPAKDDPSTLGNEAIGKVECWGAYIGGKQTVAECDAPQECCAQTGKCQASADSCEFGRQSCDGDEDCAVGSQCCRTGAGAFSCQTSCALGSVRHLSCEGECSDFDKDGIPDSLDLCVTTEREDGKGPFKDDGCLDSDADGVRDELDGCQGQPEDGKAPKPNDGCPA
jgi:hypothetical protein